jgi:hypothetical protein
MGRFYEGPPVWFRLSIPCDARLADIVGRVATRAAECLGYASEAAAAIGQSAGAAARAGMSRCADEGPQRVDVRLEDLEDRFELTLSYPAARERPASASAGRPSGTNGGAIEFHDEGGVSVGRMAWPLPEKRGTTCG